MIAPEIESLFQSLDHSLRAERAPVPEKGRPIYLYGAGNMGQEIRRIMATRGFFPVAFLDRKAGAESTCEGLPVLIPDDPAVSPEQRKAAQVIVGVFNRDADSNAIAKLLFSLGYGRVISFLEFHESFASELGDRYWLTHRRFYADHKEAIAEADQLWADDASRNVYRSLLKVRVTLDLGCSPPSCLDDQYFPPDVPPWPSPLRLADCGAYDGDTLRSLAARQPGLAVEAVAAFEPDVRNYEKLAAFSRSGTLKVTGGTCLFPCGVGPKTETVLFSEGQGEGSSISETGGTVIQCVSLDHALAGFRPNLIKMDIEGYEIAALEGARAILAESRPGLAVCVYHRPGHLWEIPLLIHRLLGGRHYLRAHGHNGFDVVHYRLP